MMEEERDMLAAVTSFYRDLFTSHAGGGTEELLQCIDARVTPVMNDILLKEFSDEEIKQGLDNIGNLKAPGHDGMPAVFYKAFWETIGDDVTKEVRNFLEGGPMPESWNDIVVVLIPKV